MKLEIKNIDTFRLIKGILTAIKENVSANSYDEIEMILKNQLKAVNWTELKKLCKQMQDMVDEKFKNLDTGAIRLLRDKVNAVENTISAIQLEQDTQNTRLNMIEDTCANEEINTSEVLNMYTKGDING